MIDIIIGSEFPEKVIPLFEEAKESVKIIVFDWRWYPNDPGNPVSRFNQAILSAKKRGVKVEVISNCYEIVSILKREKIDARKIRDKKVVHAKLIIIDDRVVVLGSHNYTQNAFTMNREVSVIFDSGFDVIKINKFFRMLFDNYDRG